MFRKFRFMSVVMFVLIVSGCAKVAHLQELLTLKAYSEAGDAQTKYVAAQNASFEALAQAVQSGVIKGYPNQRAVRKQFGHPIFIGRRPDNEGRPVELWMYRYATEYFNSPKVYLSFDDSHQLAAWEYVPAPAAPEKDL